MATVTGYTAEKAEEIRLASTVAATLSPSGDLILESASGALLNAGSLSAMAGRTTTPSIVTLESFDQPAEEVIVNEWRTTTTIGKISDPASIPSGVVRGVCWSNDAKYLAMGLNVSPYLAIYKRNEDVLTKLSNPAAIPTDAAAEPCFSPDGQYLVVPQNTTPFISIYKRTANTDTFTKLSDPSVLPTQAATAATWSPNGVYLAVSQMGYPSVVIYKRSGDVFTKITDPVGQSNGGVDVSWSPNGKYLAITTILGTPYLVVYKVTGDGVFTKMPSPTPQAGWGATVASWSPDNQYLAVASAIGPINDPPIFIYKLESDIFTKLPNLASPPANSTSGITWSPDGRYLALVNSDTPYIKVYSRFEDVFTVLPNPGGTLPSNTTTDIAWSPDGVLLTLVGGTTPFMNTYKSELAPIQTAAVPMVPRP